MSSARTRPRFLTVLVTVGLIAGFVLSAPMPTRVLAEPPGPTIEVTTWWAAGYDWPGPDVTLTLHDPATGLGTDYTSSPTSVTGGQWFIDFGQIPSFDPADFGTGEGWVVAATDGSESASITIPLLTIDAVDTESGNIFGRSTVGLSFDVDTGDARGNFAEERVEDSAATWSVILPVADRGVAASWVDVGPDQGDSFTVMFHWPTLWYELDVDDAGLQQHALFGSGWPAGASLDIAIDAPGDQYDGTFPLMASAESGDFQIDLLDGYAIPLGVVGDGWEFTATTTIGDPPDDHVMSKTLHVQHLTIETVDLEAGTASGFCAVGGVELVAGIVRDSWPDGPAEEWFRECPDGTWQIDWEVEQGQLVIPSVHFREADWDNNTVMWGRETGQSGEPRLQAFLTEDGFSGEWFTPNAEVLVTVYESDGGEPLIGPDEPFGTDDRGHFQGEAPNERGLQPGMVLEVRDDQLGITKRLELADVRFDSFDPDENVVAGYVLDPPSDDVFVQLADENYEPIVDEFGNPIRVDVVGTGWSLDLDDVGYDPNGLTEARVEVYDTDGETLARLPRVQVITPHTVQSSSFDSDFTSGVTVTLIDNTPEGPVTVVIPYVEVNLRGEFGVPTEEYGVDLDPGDVVIVTGNDTGVMKRHEVFELTVDEVDYENNTISGTAEPNVWVNVGGEFGDQTVWSGDGNWSVTVEEGIEEGMMFGVRIGDQDLDFTVVEPPPPPRIIADPFREIIRVEGFPIGHELELTVADDTGTVIGPLYGTVDGPAIGWFLIADGLFIEPGQLVTVRDLALVDPESTRDLVIADIGVSLVDDDTEILYGTVDAGAGIHVQVGTETGFGEQFIETEPLGNGEWVADFGTPEFEGVDIDKTMPWYLRLAVPDDDGDETVFEQPQASPGMIVEPNQDVVSAEGSGLGAITIRVFDDEGLVYESSGTPDHPGSPAGTFEGFEFDVFVMAGQEVYTYSRFLDLSGQVDLAPDMVAQASDVLWEMEMTVTGFSVESVDSETDTISGFNPLPEDPSGPGLVGTFLSGPTAFGFDLPNGDNWSLALTEIVNAEPGGVYGITGREAGLSFGSPTEDQPYDTYTARLWAPPEITAFDLPVEPLDIDNAVVWLAAEFTDIELPDDSHTVTVDWGDGSTETTDAAETVIGVEHSYTLPGVHPVTLTVTDAAGLFDTATQLVVVYDPDGGFATGGGWFDSPAGAYLDDPDLTGRVNFGFNAKYKKNSIEPTGETNVQLDAGDLHFTSTSYDWLVVVGDLAIYQGVGEINGQAGYTFTVLVVDDGKDDTIRIQISDPTGRTVYDNSLGVGSGSPLGKGSIVVHK